jgi:UDP-galactopyranose mutase
MWGCAPEELDLYVTGRVPVRITWKDDYHHAKYTVIPKRGYSNLFHNLLDHENINILTNTNFNNIKDSIKYKRMIYTGPLDEFFNFTYGELPYRSIRFEYKTFNKEFYQDVAQMNYPGSEPYIRIVEQKYVTGQIDSRTSIVIEYPEPYIQGKNIPHYPILCKTNRVLHKKYLKEAEKLKPKVSFAGRSADYEYYCIEQAVARALSVFENQIR